MTRVICITVRLIGELMTEQGLSVEEGLAGQARREGGGSHSG
jgi:hypothetical protein